MLWGTVAVIFLGGATRDEWERDSVGAVASGSAGLETTLSPAHVVRGADKIPWLSARLAI